MSRDVACVSTDTVPFARHQGTSSIQIDDLGASGSATFALTLLPQQEGLQKLPGLELVALSDGRVLDVLDAMCFVHRGMAGDAAAA